MLKLEKSRKDFYSPFRIFDIFTQCFNINKGALFILDNSTKTYNMYGYIGYDCTTVNKLFIPEQIGENICNSNEKPFLLDQKDFSLLKNYLSSREYGNLDSVLVIPFFTDDFKLSSFMIVSHAICQKEICSFHEIYYPICKVFLSYFYSNIKLKPDKGIYLPWKKIISKIENIVKDESTTSKYFATLFDMNMFIELAEKNLNCNFHNNLLKLFSSFISDKGKLFIGDGNRICLLSTSPIIYDKKLIAHQIMVVIKNLIPIDDNLKSEDFIQVFHLPEDITNFKDYLNIKI